MTRIIKSLSNIISKNSFIRFCIVGGICTIIDYAVYWGMLHLVKYNTAMIIGYIVSLVINYILTTMWTFRAKLKYSNLIAVSAIHIFNCFILRAGLLELFVQKYNLCATEAYLYTMMLSIPFTFILLRLYFKYSNKQAE